MKRTSTRRSLILSALSLIMCVSMFIGTTYAWFTDSVTSGRNIIQSGNLDVELKYWNGSAYTDVTESVKLFDDATLWEPGHTEVAYLKVSNAGSLALKYQLAANVYNEKQGTNVAGEKFNLSDYLVFRVVESTSDLVGKYDTREAAIADAAGGTKLTTTATEVKTLQKDASDYVALIIYMPTTVGNEANHNGDIPRIDFGVTLVATQLNFEADSFNSGYDTDAPLPNIITSAKADGFPLTLKTENVAVSVPATATEGNYTLDVSNKNVEDTSAGTSVSYDITLLKDGQPVDPAEGPFTVKIDIGAGHTNIAKVLHKGVEIPSAEYDYDFSTGILTFTTTSFSPFEVIFTVAETEWNGEISGNVDFEELKTVEIDDVNRIIYISGAEGFTYLATLAKNWSSYVVGCNSFYYTWEWKVVLLTDVDLQNKPFEPINFIWNSFDGNGNTISNVYMESNGLITSASSVGVSVSNLTVENAFIDGNTYSYVGAVIDCATSLNNVHVKDATVKGDKYVGGISGASLANINNCTVTDTTVSLSNNAAKTVGGIVGYAIVDGKSDGLTRYVSDNKVTNVQVIGTYNVGGIAGQLQGASDKIVLENNTVENTTITSTTPLPADASSNEKRTGKFAARLVDNAELGKNTEINVTINEITPEIDPSIPTAVVTYIAELSGKGIEWQYSDYNPGIQLEAVYDFKPQQTLEEALASKYANWHADFRVSLDRDIKERELVLGGCYGSFGWIGFESPIAVTANTKICLLAGFMGNKTSGWEYQDIVSQVQEFRCGVARPEISYDDLKGATFTVELILTNPDNVNEVLVVNKVTHTFN